MEVLVAWLKNLIFEISTLWPDVAEKPKGKFSRAFYISSAMKVFAYAGVAPY